MPQDCSSRDPVELLLHRIALGALLLGGCGDDALWSDRGGKAVSDDYDPCAKVPDSFPVRAASLRLAQPADYTAVRQTLDTLSRTTTVSEVGTVCANATSGACLEQVNAPQDPNPAGPQCAGQQVCAETWLVSTRGDQVSRATTTAQVREQLGAIDSYDDALMLAQSAGYNVYCVPRESVTPEGARERVMREVEGGYELFATTTPNICPLVYRRHQLFVSSAGEVSSIATRDFNVSACVGRIPAGLVAQGPRGASLGEYLARCAHLEAASVFAFERLARELRAHRAPRPLIARALEAARDEVRHARVIGALARARGFEPATPQVEDVPVRSLEQLALENAVEGCVRETYGAVVGAYQAARATDAELRFAMRSIARDEARHAALSHLLHAWLMPQLDGAASQRITDAQRALIAELRGESCDRVLREQAGLPDNTAAHAMLDALQRALWLLPVAV